MDSSQGPNSTLVLDMDPELSPLKQETDDLVSLLNQSSPDSRSLTSPKDFIQRNITAIKHLKRKELKPPPEPEAPPFRMPKPIPEDSHLLRLTQAARCKVVFSDFRPGGSTRSRTPEIAVRKVKRASTGEITPCPDRSKSAPRLHPEDEASPDMYKTPSFNETIGGDEDELIIPRLKRSKSQLKETDFAGEKGVSTESFERSLPSIAAQSRNVEPEPSFPDPFSEGTFASKKLDPVSKDRFRVGKERSDFGVSHPPKCGEEVECVLSSESESEGLEEISRYLQHWFTLYYTDFRRQTIQELLGLLIIRGNAKRAQKPAITGISQSERSRKRSRQGVVTFKEMEKRLDEVLTKGRASITRATSLADARPSSTSQFQEKVSLFLTSPSALPSSPEDPIELLRPPQLVPTTLDLLPPSPEQDYLVTDLLLNLYIPNFKLIEKRHIAMSIEAKEIQASARTVFERLSAVRRFIVLKEFDQSRDIIDSVLRETEEGRGNIREEVRTARYEAVLWQAWVLLLKLAQGGSVDRSALGRALEQLQVRTLSSRTFETLRKLTVIYLFYHTSLWRSEDRAIAHLHDLSLGEWAVVVEADLKLRTEDPLTEAAAAESLLLHMDAAPLVRFVVFMRLARHYKGHENHEKVISAGRKALSAQPALLREHGSIVLSVMLKAQGSLDCGPIPQYHIFVDKNDFGFMYQFARVSVKSGAKGTSVTARNALELLLAYSQDYPHLRTYLFHFSVYPIQFWRFMLFKVNCYYRTAAHMGSNLLTISADNPVQRKSVEKFLSEIKEVKSVLHIVYEKCKRKDLHPGKWVEEIVRKVERLDPFLGLCLFIALEVRITHRNRQRLDRINRYCTSFRIGLKAIL